MAVVAGVQWTAFQLLNGNEILDLAGVVPASDIITSIGQVESTTVELHLDPTTPSPDWLFSTTPGSAGLLAWTGDPLNPTILGGGIVTQRIRTLGPSVHLQLSTPDAYLDGCQMGAYNTTGSAINQDTMVHDIVNTFAAGANQLAWQFIHSSTVSTATQTFSFSGTTNTTVLSAIQNIAGVQGGPEWFTGWQWNTAAGTIKPTLTYGLRVGYVANPNPVTVFELGDLREGSSFAEDFTPGKGANQVITYAASNASASGVPTGNWQAPSLNGYPLWQFAFTPSQQASDTTTLNGFAQKAGTGMRYGMQACNLVLAANAPGKTFGTDWNIGDDIGFYFSGGSQFPNPVSGTGRVTGVKSNQATVTPMLTNVKLS